MKSFNYNVKLVFFLTMFFLLSNRVAAFNTIKVEVFNGKFFTIKSSGMTITSNDNEALFSGAEAKVSINSDNISINKKNISAKIVSIKSSGYLTLNNKKREKNLTVFLVPAEQGATLSVVAGIDLEDYVARVVCAEMPDSWPIEALSAQAIVSRTFASWKKKEI